VPFLGVGMVMPSWLKEIMYEEESKRAHLRKEHVHLRRNRECKNVKAQTRLDELVT